MKDKLQLYRIDLRMIAQNNKEIDEEELYEGEDDLTSLPSELSSFVDVFSKKAALTLPQHRHSDLSIDLVEEKTPKFGPIYGLAPVEQEALKEYLTENLKNGFIVPSTSPAGAPIMFVKKPDNTLRLCVDYRALNDITIKNRYPLPLIGGLFDEVKGAKIFSKLDLRGAYNLLRIKQGDEWKTAFRTRYGHFEYKVMPFGLTNAPAAFQNFMNDALKEVIDKFVIVYLDDICIYSRNHTEHTNHLRIVLEILRKHRLYAKYSKCEFYKESLTFIGHQLSGDGIGMCDNKVDAIQEWPQLSSKDEILSFLGLANYYRRFIDHFSALALPLTSLLKKSVSFVWGSDQIAAFANLKSKFTTAPILRIADTTKQFEIECDASDFALGAVLNQRDSAGVVQPVAFYSRKMIPAEINYEIYDKELLAIKCAFSEWRQYLLGSPFEIIVISDHKTLEYFLATKTLTRRQARWSLFLGEFQFVIHYRKGVENVVADALSRRPYYELTAADRNNQTHPLLSPKHFASINLITFAVTKLLSQIVLSLKTDPLAIKILSEISTANITAGEWQSFHGLLYSRGLIYVPEGQCRLDVLSARHDAAEAGHFGFRKTLELVRREFTWPQMSSYIQHYVDSCETCNRSKSTTHKPYGLIQPLAAAHRPWGSITIDFVGPLPMSQGFDFICNIVDRHNKLAHFVACRSSITAVEAVELFRQNVVRLHGMPDEIISDRGPQFKSHFWQAFFTLQGAKAKLSTGYHPETDGQTENVNKNGIGQYLRCYSNHLQDDWALNLAMAEFAYNNSYHSAIRCSPFWATYGYHPQLSVTLPTIPSTHPVPAAESLVTRLQEIHKELRGFLALARQDMIKSSDKHRLEPPVLEVGDRVWLSLKNIDSKRPCAKLDFKRQGPFRIVKKLSKLNFELELPLSMKLLHPVFHVSLLEPVVENQIVNRQVPPPPPIEIDTFMEYEVEEILNSRIYRKKLQYLVKWVGYGPQDNSYEDADNLGNCTELIAKFNREHPQNGNGRKRQQDTINNSLAMGGSVRTRPKVY